VQLGGRKTAGILMELHAEATRVGFLILGIGVNLNVRQHEFPEELRDLATSLATFSGHDVDRAAFARRLYGNLEEVMDQFASAGFEGLRSRFESRFHMSGRHVEVTEADGSSKLSGVALGIDADGSLRVRTEDGHETRVVAGDVTLTRSGGIA
jgi:BirA family biotin operon repressor/biotin-[acetyl-CoA-carboxylase] ligase